MSPAFGPNSQGWGEKDSRWRPPQPIQVTKIANIVRVLRDLPDDAPIEVLGYLAQRITELKTELAIPAERPWRYSAKCGHVVPVTGCTTCESHR